MQMFEELVESQDAAALFCHVNILYWKPRWLLCYFFFPKVGASKQVERSTCARWR